MGFAPETLVTLTVTGEPAVTEVTLTEQATFRAVEGVTATHGLKAEVKLLRLRQAQMRQLAADIAGTFYSATVVDPTTGAQVTKSFYTSERPFGAQRLNRDTGEPYYSEFEYND